MIKDLIKWRPIIIGIVMIVTFYVVSSIISGINMALPAILIVAIAVGFMVGGKIKDGTINGTIFGVIGGGVISLIMVTVYAVQGYGAYLGLMVTSLLLFWVMEIITAAVGGILGTLVRMESNEEDNVIDD